MEEKEKGGGGDGGRGRERGGERERGRERRTHRYTHRLLIGSPVKLTGRYNPNAVPLHRPLTSPICGVSLESHLLSCINAT